MSSKTIFAILWTLVSVNVITLVVGGLVTWLGYSIPVRLKQIGLLPELVITAGFASLVVACIGLGALNYSSYHALNVYGMLCTIFALLLIFGIPENWYKSNQFAHTLLLDIIYFSLLFILLVLLGFAFTFAHYLRKKELEIELFGESNGQQQNLNFPLLNRNTNLDQSIKRQHSIVGSSNNINQQERHSQQLQQQQQQQQLQLQLQPQSLSQHQSQQQQNNNCTCNSQYFFLNADVIGNCSNRNNTSANFSSSNADKWFPNCSEDVSEGNIDRTNIQQQFQSNLNTSQVNKNNHTHSGCHLSNLARASNLAGVVASSNTLDARQLSAARRNLQLANFALSTSNLNYQQQQQQQQQHLQPFILSDIGNIIQDDDKQLLLDSCSFLAPQEFVHKGFYRKDSLADSVNSSSTTLIRARSCSDYRMANGIGVDHDHHLAADLDADEEDFLDVQDYESQDYLDGLNHDDDNSYSDTGGVEIGINDANEVHIELQNFQSKSNSQENRRRRLNHGKTLPPDEVLDYKTSNHFNNNNNTNDTSKTQNSLRTRHRPWQALNLVPSNHYFRSSRDDSSIHYTNARKRKQLIEEQIFYPQVRHSNNNKSSNNNNNNELYKHRHHYHHHHRHHKHHKQQCSEQQRQFHQINPKQHSQTCFSHSPNYASHQTQLLFPFPSHQYQSATMAKQTTCRCNQILKIPASGSNIAVTSIGGTFTANSATATTTTTTTTASTTTVTASATTTTATTTTTCSPSTIVTQGLSSTINSNQGKHLKANPSIPYTAPTLLANNSTSSFIIKTNKPKSLSRSTKDSGSSNLAANATLGRLQNPNSSSLTITTKSKDDGMLIDDGHLFVGNCPTGLEHTEPTMDNYGANSDDLVLAKNQPKASDSTCTTTDTITSKPNHHHHQLDPSMLV